MPTYLGVKDLPFGRTKTCGKSEWVCLLILCKFSREMLKRRSPTSLLACINGSFPRCRRPFYLPLCSSSKMSPASRFFSVRQTLMPERDQSPFYFVRSRRHRRSVSCIAGLWSSYSCRVLPMCVSMYFGSEGRNGSRSRSCGFHL
jgi:hypothetical protein